MMAIFKDVKLSDINHTVNENVVKTLAKRLDASHKSAFQILKLTWQALFDSSVYTNRTQIAQGVQSQVLYNFHA